MTLIGTLREPPERAEAEASLARFAAGLEARLPWFEAEVAAREGSPTDGSVASLNPLAAFVTEHIGDEQPVDPPVWYTDEDRQWGWSPYGAALADGLIAYLAAIYRERMGATWVLDTDPRSAFFHRPVISVRFLGPPWTQVQGMIARARNGLPLRAGLSGAAEISLSHAEMGPAPSIDDARLEITVDPVRAYKWNMEAFLGEEAEEVLGRQRFRTLVERFQQVPGVKDAIHEDREVFLLRTRRRTDPDQLQPVLQAIVDQATEEARRERNP